MPLPALLCLCAAAAASTARGDYRLAGLFPMHSPQPRDAPQPLVDSCDDPTTFKYHGYALSQAMRFAVEEINNSSTLLPNITLGYDIYDTCSEPANLHATLRALVQKDGREVEVLSTFRNYEPQAVAVIGPDCSDVALTTAAVLSVFLVPVISYEASSEVLSQKRLYPSFLRTIPSDGQQVKAIFQLMKNFGWNWVALLGSNNAYGRDGLDALQRLLNENNMCVAYRGTFALNADASSQELHNLAAILRDIKVNVTVIFANRQSVHPFFKVMVQRNVTGMVWVGSEDWSLDQTIRQIPGIQNIGTVIGISVEMTDPAMVERFVSWKAEKSPVAGSVVLEVLLSLPGLMSSADLYSCQSCGADQWSPVSSEACFNRTIEFLSWFDPISWALLIPTVLLLLLMAGLAVLFALNFSTPVVKSAGGKMCFFMLGSLACSCSSIFCYFGEPTLHTCLLRHPLYAISFSIFLSCMTTRSFQIICIFKLNARWPALYEAWLRRGGPVLFIAASTAAQTGLCLAVEAASPSVPRRNYDTWPDRVALECGGAGWVSATAYTVLLSACCFALSYAGKDLPASYNEAKCLTCSLLLHLACSAAVLCTQGAFRGRAQATVQVLSSLCTLGALMAGYFFPKAFVILLRPHLNTPEHFQMAIQSYTRRLADS